MTTTVKRPKTRASWPLVQKQEIVFINFGFATEAKLPRFLVFAVHNHTL